MNLLIAGMKSAGKTTLFHNVQKSSQLVTNKDGLPIFSASIRWEHPNSKEKADIDIFDVNFDRLFQNADKEMGVFVSESYRKTFESCNCFVFVADPRKDTLYSDLREQIRFLSFNTSIVIVLNFIDYQSQWISSFESIRDQVIQILEEANKGFDYWFVNSCLHQKFGLKELYVVLTQPFYRIKLAFLQSMIKSTVKSMEIGRNGVEKYLSDSSYANFLARMETLKKQSESNQSELVSKPTRERARDFETFHSFYIHDKTNDPHKMIQSHDGKGNRYKSIESTTFHRYSNWRELESGSDCDDISPTDVMQDQKVGIHLSPSVLTSNLTDFFGDVIDEDFVAKTLTENLNQFPKEVGEAKSPLEQTKEETKEQIEVMGSQEHDVKGVSSGLKITPYSLPDGVVGKAISEIGNAKEVMELSDEELYPDESEFLTKTLQYSRTEPVDIPRGGDMGMSKE